jgi:hypothetical protein
MLTDLVALDRYFGALVPRTARAAELVGFGNEKANVAVADPTDCVVPPPDPPDGTTGPEPDDP